MVHIAIFGSLSVFSALLYGVYFTHRSPSSARTICKALAVGALAAISAAMDAPVLLTLALVLGVVGDVFLSQDGERHFLLGLIAFLFGHLTYIVLLHNLGGGPVALISTPARRIGCLALIAAAIWIIRQLLPHLGALRAPVMVYAVVIVTMGCAAFALPATWPLVLAMIGAFLFIASDAILGLELFVFKDAQATRNRQASLLWFLYWGGQVLILMAIIQRT